MASMGVSLGSWQALDLLQIAEISHLANLCRCHIGQIRVTPLAPSGYPLWHPVLAIPPTGRRGKGMQGIGGVYKATFGPSRARARVYRALACCVIDPANPGIRDIPSSGVLAPLPLPPWEPSHPSGCPRDGPFDTRWLYACCTEERLRPRDGHGVHGPKAMQSLLATPLQGDHTV